ncbi:2-keto-4-pentenoate hydratase [Bhargavaea cecembensis DSE10]|uniref:2-keto-4-pentenoate hydratase n=1 Tax=Bhargavaea cecembensis DSE10 TaxID=1235279 RepID=M7P8Z6_9BACL|nr:2-keto-4-pentenoate hydratase [Bhargavaea cecembensis]EMR06979.1 2-keto-4-pentenoate hydratase [Bhargavaea cecembensis DSE10]
MDRVKAAQRLREAERTGKPIPPFTSGEEKITVEDAYQIQLLNIRERIAQGAEVKGLKIGLTSKPMQDMFGVNTPDYGHILDDMVYGSDEPVKAGAFIQPKVEFEIAFFLKQDLKGPDVMAEDVLAATDYVVPAVEIIDSRIRDWKFKFEDTVADNGSSAGAVLGDKRTGLDGIDLAGIGMKAYKNGELLDEATGAAVMGNPANAVAWLANAVAEYGIELKAGQFILSGALAAAVPFEPGDEFRADFGNLGDVSVSFATEEVMN